MHVQRQAWVAVALLAVLLTGCGPTVAQPAGRSGGPSLAGAAPLPPPGGSTGQVTSTPPRILPVTVRIPKIGAQSSLLRLGLNPDGTVQVPPVSQPLQAGWWDGGAAPGENGPAVLLGHVDGDKQEGVFFRLHELAAGDDVDVTRADGSVLHFTVTNRTEVAKNAFPTDAVYGPTSDPELRLVTCGGTFDPAAHSYEDSIIVYAKLANG